MVIRESKDDEQQPCSECGTPTRSTLFEGIPGECTPFFLCRGCFSRRYGMSLDELEERGRQIVAEARAENMIRRAFTTPDP